MDFAKQIRRSSLRESIVKNVALLKRLCSSGQTAAGTGKGTFQFGAPQVLPSFCLSRHFYTPAFEKSLQKSMF